MPAFTPLTRRGVVHVHGPGATAFLDSLVTAKVTDPSQGGRAALLSPQGKILVEMWLRSRSDMDGYLLDVPRGEVDDLTRRLALFKLRAKVTIDDRSEDLFVEAAADLSERRITDGGTLAPANGDTLAAYDAARVLSGEPEQGVDYDAGEVFPSDVNLDLLAGVDYAKGCFVGQEVVSRMKRRGTIRKRTLVLDTDGGPPAPGAEIVADGVTLGTALGSAGGRALARVRLDRLAAADPETIRVNDRPAVLTHPAWFPEDARASTSEKTS